MTAEWEIAAGDRINREKVVLLTRQTGMVDGCLFAWCPNLQTRLLLVKPVGERFVIGRQETGPCVRS